MELQVWNVILFGLKWVFLGLVFLMLSIIVLAVRREMALRVATRPEGATFTPGKLRVVNPGKDMHKKSGELLDLKLVTNLGSEQDNEIVLTDTYISRHHARLRWDGAAWSIEDLGSQNGTFVNQNRCDPFQEAVVPSGAILKLGEMAFELLE
jgi:hypothetical protein